MDTVERKLGGDDIRRKTRGEEMKHAIAPLAWAGLVLVAAAPAGSAGPADRGRLGGDVDRPRISTMSAPTTPLRRHILRVARDDRRDAEARARARRLVARRRRPDLGVQAAARREVHERRRFHGAGRDLHPLPHPDRRELALALHGLYPRLRGDRDARPADGRVPDREPDPAAAEQPVHPRDPVRRRPMGARP